jgi:hypothetical protein
VRWRARYQHVELVMTYYGTAPVADVSVRQTHDSSRPASVDWPDLRNHLVNTHEEPEDDIDDFDSYPDGTTGRRRHAEERHRTLHGARPKGWA